MSDADNILVRELPKNQSETLRIQLTTYNGHHLCDVRSFVRYESSGDVGPTRKGVTVKLDQLDALIAGLTEARDKARALGRLNGGGR